MIVMNLPDGRALRARQPKLGKEITVTLLSKECDLFGKRDAIWERKIAPDELMEWLLEKVVEKGE